MAARSRLVWLELWDGRRELGWYANGLPTFRFGHAPTGRPPTPLARRPYDLRHAAVSTWLSGGIPPTTVARWAGHSVSVLLDIYASCLYGQDVLARKQVEAALGAG